MANLLSYASTPTTEPVLYKTFVDMMKHWAGLYPDKDAFVEYGEDGVRKSLTCSQLLSRAETFGKYLLRNGLNKGGVVVMCMKNSLNMITAMLGVYLCGGICACIMSNLQDGSDVIDYLKDTCATIFIADAKRAESSADTISIVLEASKDLQIKKIILNNNDDHCESEHGETLASFQTAVEHCTDERIEFPCVQPEDTANYFRTSGSSGKPKIVAHPHFSWIDNTYTMKDLQGIDANSVYFSDRPFGWGVGSPRTFFATGATRVILDTSLVVSKNIIDTVSDIIAAEACTHVYLPGYLAVDLQGRQDLKHKFASVDNVICSGERIPKSHSQLIGQFCRRLSIWYGSTEMNGVSLYVSSDPSTFEDGLIGTPTPGVEMKIVDSEGQVVRKGDHGELFARNIHRLSTYVGLPEQFQEFVDNNNWCRSGDTGYVREDGNFVLDGRNSEQIALATLKFFPFEVEKQLLKCPGVSGVVVVPVPDVRWTNAICACLTFDKSSSVNISLVKEFCDKIWVSSDSTTGISLRPKYFLEFESIITNANGKLDRLSMAKEARKMLKL